jgi:hypothetical protein
MTTMARLVMVIALGLVCPAVLQAQAVDVLEAPSSNPRETARIRWSPVYLTPSFRVEDVAVDSNVFNSATNPRADFTTTLVPALEAWVPVARRFVLSTRAASDLVWFKSFASERSVNPEVDARGDLRGTRIDIFAATGWSRSRQRPSFEIDARSRRVQSYQQGGVVWRATGRVRAEFIATRHVIEYDQQEDLVTGSNLRTALSRHERSADLYVRYALTPLTTTYARVQVQDDLFTRSVDRDTTGGRIALGATFDARALVSGSVEIGVRKLRTKAGDLPDFTGLVGSAVLGHTTGGTRVSVMWHRDVAYSYQRERPYYIDTEVGARVRRQLFGNVDAIVSATRNRYAYRMFSALLMPSEPGDLRRVEYGVDVGYRIRPDLRIGFGVSNWQRTSRVMQSRSQSGSRWGVSLTYGVL